MPQWSSCVLVRVDELQNAAPIATFANAEAAADFVAHAKTVPSAGRSSLLFADGATVKAGSPGLTLILR